MVYKPRTSPERWRLVENVFHEALQIAPAERAGFLFQKCGVDSELIDEVSHLLVHHDDSDPFINPPDAALAANLPRSPGVEDIPETIGSFEIIRVIASGGMGQVYEAVQQHPRRTVALKVMRFGHASNAALRRFNHESHVLGRLRHPGIAQIYDAGTYRDGSKLLPYFAMEYIQNARTVVEYATDLKLNVRQRLELMAKVCDAVHHGHQHGIIHRDLKPANVLVDASGQPKVIDFGVARATDSDMAVTTIQTNVGQLIGTLVYMSPEQCAADPYGIDTRSDVYSLGVVMYEMLCGRLPYDVRNKAIADAARTIQESPPRRPTCVEQAFRGDVETIILTALEKDRDRRYQSAADLAADIRRYLYNQPVQAKPPGMMHALRLFARRNRAAVIGGAFAVMALVVATGVSTTFGLRAIRAAGGEAKARDGAERVTAFLQDMIASASPYRTGRNVSVLEMLDDATERVHAELGGQPEAEAGVRFTIAQTHAGMWLWNDAVPNLKQALKLYRGIHGERHATVADCLSLLGLARTYQRDNNAIFDQKRALGIRRELYGANDPLVAESLGNLAFAQWASSSVKQWNLAELNYVKALKILEKHAPQQQALVARFTSGLGAMYAEQDRLEEAEASYSEALRIYRAEHEASGIKNVDMVRAMNDFSTLLQRMGRLNEAADMLRESIDLTPEGIAEVHVCDASWHLGALHHHHAEWHQAEKCYRESLAVRCRWLAREFPDKRDKLQRIEKLLLVEDDSERGTTYRKAFQAFDDLSSWGESENFRGMHDLGDVLQHTNPAAGADLLAYCLRNARKYLNPTHWFIADVESILGSCMTSLGRFEEAEPLLIESHPYLAYAPDKRDGRMRESLERIVQLYIAWEKPGRASTYRVFLDWPADSDGALPSSVGESWYY